MSRSFGRPAISLSESFCITVGPSITEMVFSVAVDGARRIGMVLNRYTLHPPKPPHLKSAVPSGDTGSSWDRTWTAYRSGESAIIRKRWSDGGIAGCSLYAHPELLIAEQITAAAMTTAAGFDLGMATVLILTRRRRSGDRHIHATPTEPRRAGHQRCRVICSPYTVKTIRAANWATAFTVVASIAKSQVFGCSPACTPMQKSRLIAVKHTPFPVSVNARVRGSTCISSRSPALPGNVYSSLGVT